MAWGTGNMIRARQDNAGITGIARGINNTQVGPTGGLVTTASAPNTRLMGTDPNTPTNPPVPDSSGSMPRPPDITTPPPTTTQPNTVVPPDSGQSVTPPPTVTTPPPPSVPPPPGTPRWQQFRFSNPTTPDQQNFNYLAGIDPMAAFGYGFGGTGAGPIGSNFSNELRQAIDAYTGDRTGGTSAGILGIYHGGVPPTSQIGKSLGLTDANSGLQPGQMGGGGQYTWNGQNYQLPGQINWGQHMFWGQPGGGGANWTPQDYAFAQANAAHGQKVNQAAQANAIGSPAWWAAVNASRGPAGPPTFQPPPVPGHSTIPTSPVKTVVKGTTPPVISTVGQPPPVRQPPDHSKKTVRSPR